MASVAPTTMGELLAHVPRQKQWGIAVTIQILVAGLIMVLVYYLSPSFFTSVPWRLSPLLSWGVYISLLFLLKSYIGLFLPRTPVSTDKKLTNIGVGAVGAGVLGLMMSIVLGLEVKDTRILAGCTGVIAAFIVGLVAFWVWLSRTYGGGGGDTLPITIRTTNSSSIDTWGDTSHLQSVVTSDRERPLPALCIVIYQVHPVGDPAGPSRVAHAVQSVEQFQK